MLPWEDDRDSDLLLLILSGAVIYLVLKSDHLEKQMTALQASGTGGLSLVASSQPTSQTGLTVDGTGCTLGTFVYENASTLSQCAINSTEAKAKPVGVIFANAGAGSVTAKIYNDGSQVPLATLVALNAAWAALDGPVYMGAAGIPSNAAPAQSSGNYCSYVGTVVQGTFYCELTQIPFVS